MKTLLVAMSRPDTVYGTHPARYAVISGRKVLGHGVGAVDEVQAQPGRSLRLSLDSPANFTEPLRLRALSRRFVPILVQRHLSDTGAFTERFRARSHIDWVRQGEAEVHVQAMLEEDAELAQDLLPTEERPLTHLVTPEAAVAALVGAATQQPVLVHWWHAGALRSLGVRAGRVAWQRVQPLGNFSADATQTNWRSLLQTATSNAPAEFDGPNSQTLRLGDGPWAGSQDWAGQGAKDLMARLESLFKGIPVEVVLKDPDLYGLAFVRFDDSLVINGYRQRVLAWRWAPALAGAASAAGAALLVTGIWWHGQAERERSALQLEQATLTRQAQTLRKQLPPAEAVAALQSAAWRETALGANLRTDRFLAELLEQMPQGVQITSLRLQRNGSAAERVRLVDGQPVPASEGGKSATRRSQVARKVAPAGSAVVQPAALPPGFTAGSPVRRMPIAGEPSFQVDLDILLTGGYAVAKLKGEQLAEKLTRLGRLSDTRLTFEDSAPATPGARLKTRLTIAAGALRMVQALQAGTAPATDEDALIAHLRQAGLLSPQQAGYAHRVARSLARPVAEVLRTLRLASDTDIARSLADLHGLPYWQPDTAAVDPEALARVPFAFARQHRLLPLGTEGQVLHIAVEDPDDMDAQQRLRRHVSGSVQWLVAPRSALTRAIEMAYHFAAHPSADELERELARLGGDLDGGRLIRLALADGVERGASDVHFSPSGFALLVSYRIDGVLQLQHVLPADLHLRVASAIKIEAGMDIAEARRPQDGSFTLALAGQHYDLRVSTMPTTHGENLVVRILSLRGDVLPLDQCGFWPDQVAQIERLVRAPHGLVLATGPTGSGKTTTLYAGLRLINALERNVMTVEDPVEYHVPLVRQVRLNEKAGMTFSSAVKGFLRQDPDVMLVGEIRDAETASMAVRAAQTGHLVPSTLHTNDAVGAIARLRDLQVPVYLLSATLRGVIGQRLVRRLCPSCRAPAGGPRYRAVGCSRCNGSGYRGRLCVGEVLVIDDTVRALIDQEAGESEIRRTVLSRGFVPMRAWAQRLVDVGITDAAELDRVFGEGSP